VNQNLKDLNFLKKNFEQLKAIYHRQQGEQATIQEQEASLQESVKEIHEQVDCLEQVRLLLMEAAKHAREQGRRQVELLPHEVLQLMFH
jgi:predicted nuclease with TOPRIM domain